MAEQLINEFTVNRPIDEAWPIITDVERIAPCLPGAQLTEIRQTDDGEVYTGNVKVKLGAIATEFKGDAYFVERNDANYTCKLNGKGRDTKGRGNASADISAAAESLSPTSTKVVVTTDLHITGKIAQFGRGILGDVSTKLIDQFSQNLNEMIDADGIDDTANAAPELKDSTSERAEPAVGESASTESAEPTVRKIDGPAAEAIDLMEMGGSSIAKRAAPAIAALLIILFLLGRRRS
ncbi:MAG: SRPBCC family protein [Ilumatobacter sp.]|nr:SRPBCC family protein [Ilumatobacter sp.]